VAFEEIAENNKSIAQINADNMRDSNAAYDAILSAAKRQQEIAMIREDMLKEARRDKFFTEVKYLSIIIAGIIGISL